MGKELLNQVRISQDSYGYEVLRDGKWISTEQICQETGMSETAIYKRFRRFLIQANSIEKIWATSRGQAKRKNLDIFDGTFIKVTAEEATKPDIDPLWKMALCMPWR